MAAILAGTCSRTSTRWVMDPRGVHAASNSRGSNSSGVSRARDARRTAFRMGSRGRVASKRIGVRVATCIAVRVARWTCT